MHGPERARVVISEHIAGFTDDFHRRAPAQYLVTVEVFSHQARILRISGAHKQRFVLFFGTHGWPVSETAQQNLLSLGVSHVSKNDSILDVSVVLRRHGAGPETWTGVLAESRL